MHLVVDSNQLQSQALSAYLKRSTSNLAVLPDYVAMEAYKGDTLASIYKSMSVLAERPAQVIVLKGTRRACAASGRLSGLQRRLIDEDQTRGFSDYIKHLRMAEAGHRGLQQQLLQLGREADFQMGRVLADAKTMMVAFEEIAGLYSKVERQAVRSKAAYPPGFTDKTTRNIMWVAAHMFQDHPDVRQLPSGKELPNTFIFRVALCMYLLALEWGANGGIKDAKPERVRNDMVDTFLAAYATYFDGLLTADAKVKRIHAEARLWLDGLFDVQMPSGWQGYHADGPC